MKAFKDNLTAIIFNLNKWTKEELESDEDFTPAFNHEEIEVLWHLHEHYADFLQYIADNEYIQHINS